MVGVEQLLSIRICAKRQTGEMNVKFYNFYLRGKEILKSLNIKNHKDLVTANVG